MPLRRGDDGTGKIWAWVGAALDIHDIREAEMALHESEGRFRTLADTMPQMVWSARGDGHVDYCNARWHDFTGVAHGCGDGDAWEVLVHPESLAEARERWRTSLRTGEPCEIEYRLWRHDSAYRWTLTRALPMHDEAGPIVRWFGTSTDIQDIVEAREVLTRDRAGLERLVEGRTRELQEAHERLAHAQRMEVLGQIGTLTQRLLAFSRSDHLWAEPLHAASLLSDMRVILMHTLGDGIDVRVEVEAGLPPLLADRGQLETVLVSLATNGATPWRAGAS